MIKFVSKKIDSLILAYIYIFFSLLILLNIYPFKYSANTNELKQTI